MLHRMIKIFELINCMYNVIKLIQSAVVLIALTIVLSGCGGGNDSPTFTQGENPVKPSSTSNLSPVTDIPENLVSFEDSSIIVDAVARGLDLEFDLLRTTFHCYYHVGAEGLIETDFSEPHLTTIFTGNTVEAFGSVGNLRGSVRDVENSNAFYIMFDGLEDEFGYRIEFDSFGQWFKAGNGPNDVEELAGCYQTGASHERALHQFQLNTPEAGEYNCQVAENGVVVSDSVPLALAPNGQYTFSNASGAFLYANVFEGASSQVRFDTGPLVNWEGEYTENPDTGRQVLTAGVDDSEFQCEKQRSPRPFKRYGKGVVTPPAASSKPLSGVYYLGNLSDDAVGWAEFSANGFFNTELPPTGGSNCQRVLPNGLEPCLKYVRNGTNITLSGRGEEATFPFSEQSDGTIILGPLGQYSPINTPSLSELTGVWQIDSVDPVDTSLCILGFCSGGTSSFTHEFFADGQFITSRESSNLVGSVVRQSASAGTYLFNGPLLQLNYDSGQLEPPAYIHLLDPNTLIIGYRIFSRLQ